MLIPSTLYIVGLPIGNLGDVSQRALQILTDADVALAEDTRELVKFLRLTELPHKEILSYRDQNHDRVLPDILRLLEQGKTLALTSDQGTPGISDPGYKLIRDVIDAGFRVEHISGPVAAISALLLSGLPTDRFTFIGFPPRTKGKQQKLIAEFAELPATFILYESPFRVVKLLESIAEELGEETQVAAISEISKLHEQVHRGTVREVIDSLKAKGKNDKKKGKGEWKLKGEWVVVGRK